MSTQQLQTAEDATNAFLATWGIRPATDWTSLVLPLITVKNRPIGYVFVRETKRPDIWKGQYTPMWKLAGGHKNPEKDSSPRATAARELQEETPLRLVSEESNDLILAGHHTHRDGSHEKFYFSITLERPDEKFDWTMLRGNEGEEPGFFSIGDTMRLFDSKGFLKPHMEKLKEYRLIM